MDEWLYPVILLILYFVFKWCQDTVDHHFEKSIFNSGSPWEPNYESFWYHDWRRKYYLDDPKFGRNWIPVWLLDGWHFFGMLRNLMVCFLFAELANLNILLAFTIYLIILNVSMYILYRGLLIKKEK